jgi:hypothetical protein
VVADDAHSGAGETVGTEENVGTEPDGRWHP